MSFWVQRCPIAREVLSWRVLPGVSERRRLGETMMPQAWYSIRVILSKSPSRMTTTTQARDAIAMMTILSHVMIASLVTEILAQIMTRGMINLQQNSGSVLVVQVRVAPDPDRQAREVTAGSVNPIAAVIEENESRSRSRQVPHTRRARSRKWYKRRGISETAWTSSTVLSHVNLLSERKVVRAPMEP